MQYYKYRKSIFREVDIYSSGSDYLPNDYWPEGDGGVNHKHLYANTDKSSAG